MTWAGIVRRAAAIGLLAVGSSACADDGDDASGADTTQPASEATSSTPEAEEPTTTAPVVVTLLDQVESAVGEVAYSKSVTISAEDGPGYTFDVEFAFAIGDLVADVRSSPPGSARLSMDTAAIARITNTTPGRDLQVTSPGAAFPIFAPHPDRGLGSCYNETIFGESCDFNTTGLIAANPLTSGNSPVAAEVPSSLGPGESFEFVGNMTTLTSRDADEAVVNLYVSDFLSQLLGFEISFETSTANGQRFVFDAAGVQIGSCDFRSAGVCAHEG